MVEGFGIRRVGVDRVQIFWDEGSKGVAVLQRSRDLLTWEDEATVDLGMESFLEFPVSNDLSGRLFLSLVE